MRRIQGAILISFLIISPLVVNAQSVMSTGVEGRERALRDRKSQLDPGPPGTARAGGGGTSNSGSAKGITPNDYSYNFPVTPVGSVSTDTCYYNCFYLIGSPVESCNFSGSISLAKQVGLPFRVTNLRKGVVGSCSGTPVSLPVTLSSGERLLQDFEFRPTTSGSFQDSHDYFMTPTGSSTSRWKWNLSGTTPNATDACAPKTLTIPSTIQGTITSASCLDTVINSYEDVYSIFGIAGQTVTIDYSSTAYDVFLWMEGIETQRVSYLFTGVSRSKIVYTFPETRNYKLEAETLYGPGDSSPHSGPYTLSVTTGSAAAGCTPSSTKICLAGDRFEVSATWRTSDGNSGSGQATRLTPDTGYFTFFNSSNVEVVLKVLNGCGVNSRYWIFAGGLTNVNVVLTIRDTQTGAVKTYTNPLNVAFQPIQDTNAMSTCP